MLEMNAARVRVFCKDCGQPLAVIQQEDMDGGFLIQVTCWQPSCLLRGFTLSLNRYKSLTECELEIYRKMNRIYPPQFVRVDS